MNLFRTLGAITLFGLGWAGTSSCLNAPDYPTTPTITFNEIKSIYAPPTAQSSTPGDTIVFVVDFQDGDGDLGLDPDDVAVAPYKDLTGGHNNLSKANNFLIQAFKQNKATGQFAPFYTQNRGFPGENDSTYPRLETDKSVKPAPVKGTMRFKLRLPLNRIDYAAGDIFKFEVSIMDRAFHQSNTVTTTPITLGP